MALVSLMEKGLLVPFGSELAYFNYFWLRDNCPSSWDIDTQERTFDILAEPDDLGVRMAELRGNHLYVTWRTGHESQYDLRWLESWYKEDGRIDLAVRTRQPWYSNHYENMARFDFETLMASPAEVLDWAEALLDDGIALVKGMQNTDHALQSLCELLGIVRPSYSGLAFDVCQKVDPVNLAYTNKALELHTDEAAEEFPPGVQFLHCRVNEVAGGNSLFVDAMAVANELRDAYPEYFRILTEYKVPFRYTTHSHDIRAKQRLIEIDHNNGEVSGINFSQHLADIFDFPQHEMDVFYPAYRKFGQMLQDPRFLMTFRLNAGECIVFDNHRVAHGRTSFEDGGGFRHLRGCYVDRGELRSTYRVLKARYPNGGRNT
ncbi:TauD/TfdA family dioxygenase [uncultured Sneathiella sp.]|uniref:TauD/TfdA family dioxygenase n=1 Tax=uncultured Sneathiella sp. TaxID=879315 RepID=UPI00259A0A02|nr:TauD/TfdA family dioxygenase [uncultured Sneathiella sp.]